MDYGTQLVALCVVLVVTIEFFQYRRVKLLSTELFEGFLGLSIFCIVCDIGCIYASFHPQYFSILINRIIHQFFFASLSLVAFYVFIYIDLRGRKVKNYSTLELLLRAIPLIIAILGILFGDINYSVSVKGAYSYGTLVNIVYIMSATYCVMAIAVLAYAVKNRHLVVKYDFIFCFAAWLFIAIYQYLVPTASLISLAIALIVMFVYISFENSKENEDKDIHSLLSRNAFEMVIDELFGENKNFYVICFSMQNTTSLRSTYSLSTCLDCIAKSVKSIPDFSNRNIFRISEFSFGFILFSKEELTDWSARYKVSDKALLIEDSSIQPTYIVSAVECPTSADNAESLFSLISFCQSHYEAQNDHSVLIVDKEIADKRNYIHSVERLIQRAVDEDGFYVVYQPIINTKTNRCESAEALVRLKDTKSFGFISPEVFIPVAERRGLISMIGDQVFSKVCHFIKDNEVEKLGLKYIEVNLSGIQIADPSIPFRLHQTVKSYGLDPKMINLEVTETALVRSGKVALDNMEKLKSFGYKFSMDDFGTGYSNLSQVAAVKYDLVKMDKSLIWPAFEPNNEQARTIMIACIKMFHTLGISVVAEGVETSEQAEVLAANGVEFLQGYHYSKPVKEDKFLEFVQEFNKTRIEAEIAPESDSNSAVYADL
ncbi:MAG: EAL domain-containing protein [Succinatimonas sp.]|nr:EAL domain-containing protein [Succinatimonas sp.]